MWWSSPRVNKMVLQGPPVGDPATLSWIVYSTYHRGQTARQIDNTAVLTSMRDEAKSFSGVQGLQHLPAGDSVRAGRAGAGVGAECDDEFLRCRRSADALGRGFGSHEDHSPVVVLGYGLWRQYFKAR